ncbi:hypothetical protein [Rhodopseudomonas palustris]|uniref:hypothetical protein n=1 Tax=Rhodopseudomonas palustris TaxID=1076 RepID=UPI00064269DC|nr:hypothetical protein [Rhodopseudomonas palustris]
MLARKYVARADERQKAMGLSYVTAEFNDLAATVAQFAASEINNRAVNDNDTAARPPISATQAIVFAVEKIEDHFDRLGFLRAWMHGEWTALRDEWPEAFTGPQMFDSAADAKIADLEAKLADATKRITALRAAWRLLGE